MREKIIEILKDWLIIAYAATLLVFFLNILCYGNATWTETGWILYGETITFVFVLVVGIYWLVRDMRK